MTEITLRTKTTGVRKSPVCIACRGFYSGQPGQPWIKTFMVLQVQHHILLKQTYKLQNIAKKTNKDPWIARSYNTNILSLASLTFGSKICHLQFHSFVSCKSHLQGRQFVGCFPLPGLMLMLEAARHISICRRWVKLRSVRRWLQHPATGNEFWACHQQMGHVSNLLGPHGPLAIVGYSKSS